MNNLKDIETTLLLFEQRITDKIKSHSRNWLIACAIACVLVIVLLLIGFQRVKSMREEDAQSMQGKLEQLAQEQKKTAEQDRLRDSVNWADFQRNSNQRNQNVSTYKKQSNDKINSINSPDFTNDSIRRAFAN